MEKQKEQIAEHSQTENSTKEDRLDLSKVDMSTKIHELLGTETNDEEMMHKKLQAVKERINQQDFPEGFTLRHFESAEFKQEFSSLLAKELNLVDANVLAPILSSMEGQEALDRKFLEYEKQHDQAMEKEFSRELREKTARAPISPEMAIQHLEGDEFEEAYFEELLRDASPELLEELEEHSDLRDKLFSNASVRSGLKQKYREYEEAHDRAMEEKFSAELEQLINAGELTDDFSMIHREEDEFSTEYFELMLRDASPELLEELGEHRDLKEKLFATGKVKDALGEKFKNYEQEHERMMENTFSRELEELIEDTPIPPDMAIQHLEGEEFEEEFFLKILEKASPELRLELEEHAELQETLFSHGKVSGALKLKTKDYEKAHQEAMEKKFTAEIAEKVKARRISPEFANKHRDEEEFQDDFFQEILGEASPELREELGEHEDLEETLFAQAEVESVLEKRFLDYEKAHDASMEAKFSQELRERIPAAKISEKMAAQDFEKDEFSRVFFDNILKGSSPELKEELGEHQDLRQKLFGHKGVQTALGLQFKSYQKIREKELAKAELKKKQKQEKEAEAKKAKEKQQEEEAMKIEKDDIEANVKQIPTRLLLTEEDIAEENYHREQGGFGAFSSEMNERIAELLPEKVELREQVQTVADREITKSYAAWKQGHEQLHSAEMKSARQEIDTALILQPEDYEEENFHDPKVLKDDLQARLSLVFATIPDDLHAGLRSYTREKMAQAEAQWRQRHEQLESKEMKDAKKQLAELFILGDADKEDETLHDRKRFHTTMLSRLKPVLSLLPDDLQEALQPWMRTEIGELHTVWAEAHEAHEKSLIEKAEKNIDRKLELNPDDRDNELFHKERTFRTAMRSRIVGVLQELPGDLKQEVATIAEAKISDSYHEWREAHEREHEQNLAMANTEFDRIIDNSGREFQMEGDQVACSADITDRAAEVIDVLPEDLQAEAKVNLAEKMDTFFRSWKKTEVNTTAKKSPWEKSADFSRFSEKDLERGHERLEALAALPSMKALVKQKERFFMPFLLMTTIMLSESEFGNLKRSLQGKTLAPEETMRLIFADPSRQRKTLLMKEHSPEIWKGFKQGLEKMKLPLDDVLDQQPSEDEEETSIEEETDVEHSEENREVPTDLSQKIDERNTLGEEDVEEVEEILDETSLEKNEKEEDENGEDEDREIINQDQESKENTEKKQGTMAKTFDKKEELKTKPLPKISPDRQQEKAIPVVMQKKTPATNTRLEEKTPDITKQVPSTEQPRAIKDMKPTPEKRIPDKKTEAPKVIAHKEKTEERKPRLIQIEQEMLQKNNKEKDVIQYLHETESVPFMFHADVQRDEQLARYLESILLEKETISISLKYILRTFIEYTRLSSGISIPFTMHISPDILDLTVLDPQKLFTDLAQHYHGCCEQHAESSHFLFRSWYTPTAGSVIDLRIAFDIEQREINEVCAAFIDCQLEKTVELSLS